MSETDALDPPEMQEMVARIITDHFGGPPRQIVAQPKAHTNSVYLVEHPEGELVVRVGASASKIDAFVKEQWATAQARIAGVPTPEMLVVECPSNRQPYTISRRAPGHLAHHHPERLHIVRQMGHYAAKIHSIPTAGFGFWLEASGEPRFRCRTWREFLLTELKLEARLEVLEQSGMLTAAQIERLGAVCQEIIQWEFSPALNHGDLRLKNVLVDDAGSITCILDWEHCASSRAPEWELSLALHDRSIDEKQEFLAGYGLSSRKMMDLAPAVKAFNLLNYAPEIQRLMQAHDAGGLDECRARLSGAFDLYSL